MQSHRPAYADLSSKVVACVPQDELQSVPWAVKADKRRQAQFVSYATCAANEALLDAKWQVDSPAAKEATGVAIGAGMSSTQDMAEAGMLVAQVSIQPLALIRQSINIAGRHACAPAASAVDLITVLF